MLTLAAALSAQTTQTKPLDSWKTYLRWHLVNGAAGYLSSAFVNEDFH